jgi:two-component system OmpR family response regulator
MANRARDRSAVSGVDHILLIDKDPWLRLTLPDYFEKHCVLATSVANRYDALRFCQQMQPSLIILGLRHGGDDELDALREIRSNSDVPVILTAAHPSSENERVIGLELGADDYLTEPFSLRELLARVRAVLRRQEMGHAARRRDPDGGGYSFGGWQLSRRDRRLISPNGTQVSLSKGQYGLLLAFLAAPQRPLTREELLQATRMHEDIFDRGIDVQVWRLRRKLKTGPDSPSMIGTVHGVGYVFTPEVGPFQAVHRLDWVRPTASVSLALPRP